MAFLVYLAVQVLVIAVTQNAVWAAAVGAVSTVPMFLLTGFIGGAGGTGLTSDASSWRIPSVRRVALWCIALLPIWVAGQALSLWLFANWPGAAAGYQRHVEQLAATPQVLTLVLTLILAPVAEELLMRGILYRELRRTLRVNIPVATVASSAVFALLHGNGVQIGATMLLGILLALAYEFTGSIIVPIALHAGFNLLSTFVPPSVIEPLTPTPVVALLVIGATMLCAAIYLFKRFIRF